jgi:hypothetical protein
MTTSRISMTDARRDLLLVAADAIERGVTVSPWVARDAITAFRQLAADHDRYVAVTRRVRSQHEEAPVG